MIEVDEDILKDLESAKSREWLETNGIGGFAAATIIGLNTRRYHGLLTAATNPPVGRIVMLSKLEETLIIGDLRHDLSTNQYPGVAHPQGFQLQTGFRLDPFPVFTYEVDGLKIEKSVFMIQGENSTVVQYEMTSNILNSQELIKLEVRPLIAFRDYHSTTHENGALDSRVTTEDDVITVAPYRDLPALYFTHDAVAVEPSAFWYRNFQYSIEQERGLDFSEDLFSPFAMTFELSLNKPVSLIASIERHNVREASRYREAEVARRKAIEIKTPVDDELAVALASAADQFIVSRGEQKTIIAGYHWFADWGRDSMIALPGLTLTMGRVEIAKSILLEFAKHVDQGMLPNRFPDAGEKPEYNTVDATLWFFEAVRALVEQTHDYDFVRDHLYAVLSDIIDWHVRGTRYRIHVDADGLLFSGEPGVQLTWMDAKVGDLVVTPRTGKAVEIQALWYNALRVMEELAKEFKDKSRERLYKSMAAQARKSFNEQFWNAEAGCLYDVVDGEVRDASIRPNQIFAISLKHSMVSKVRAKSILAVVERELLTPRGLRTLSPNDSRYIGRYEGDPAKRDGAYHQGTVWPWLMGAYLTAYLKTFSERAGRKVATDWLKDFELHLDEACLGQVSEIFDGDAPHASRGCVAQAWSVAELLRALAEVSGTKPISRAAVAS